MAKAVLYKGYQVIVNPVYADLTIGTTFLLFEQGTELRLLLHDVVNGAYDDFDNLNILTFIMTAYIVN